MVRPMSSALASKLHRDDGLRDDLARLRAEHVNAKDAVGLLHPPPA